jgi:predicted nucleic acid-binding protein
MPFVLDASVVACWAFPDEMHPIADRAFAIMQHDQAVVPSLFWFEIRNILVVNERRKRLTVAESNGFLQDLGLLRMRVDHTPNEVEVLRLARSRGLTVYDAAYLELAQREGLRIATLDTALAKAGTEEGVPSI